MPGPIETPADRRRRIVKNWRKILDELSLTINKIDRFLWPRD